VPGDSHLSERIRVAIFDEQPLFRAGIVHVLAAADIETVAEGASAADLVKIAGKFSPDVILCDIGVLGAGLKALKALSTSLPPIRTMILTLVADREVVLTALRGGAAAYVLKQISGPELVESVRRVHSGERYVFPSLAARLLGSIDDVPESASRADLSRREEQILSHLGRGLSNKEIGRSLDLSEKTIKHYLGSLLTKLNARNRVQAAIISSSYFIGRDRIEGALHGNRASLGQ
jgi:two-component system nitrate/nitrite response regulator NarL